MPDGDTGTNMLLTMRSTSRKPIRGRPQRLPVAQAMATGALMGARGNSGVILSQIWSGMARAWTTRRPSPRPISPRPGRSLPGGLQGLCNPVEGTILTVMKDVSKAAKKGAAEGGRCQIRHGDGRKRGPRMGRQHAQPAPRPQGGRCRQMPAGKAFHAAGRHAALPARRGGGMQFRKPHVLVASRCRLTRKTVTAPEAVGMDEIPYGYCTEFLLKGQELDPEDRRKRLEKQGQSLIVVGDNSHRARPRPYPDPGNSCTRTSIGTMHSVNVRNMDEQHEDFLACRRTAPVGGYGHCRRRRRRGLRTSSKAWASPASFPGGQTMNPSTKDIVQAVEAS